MPALYKASAYNHFQPIDSGQIIAYNFLTKSMLLFSQDEYQRVKEIISDLPNQDKEQDEQLFRVLKEYRFIISDKFNELEYFKFNYFRSLYGSSTLSTIVLPTLDCNFQCPYCFEFKKDLYMGDGIINAYLSWAKNKLKQCKDFHISWFGGEPLLGFNVIKSINQDMIGYCDANRIGFSSSLTTNGFLLTNGIIDDLNDLRINNVHITFDGPKEWHDYYRRTKNNEGSFDTLVKNVENYCGRTQSQSPITIRINVTDANMGSIPELLDAFSEQVKKKSQIYYRYIWPNKASNYIVFSEASGREDAFKELSRLYNIATERGYRIANPTDGFSFNYCEVDFANHFAVDPSGYLYLCTHTFKQEEAIGNVLGGSTDEQVSYYCEWINSNPFNDAECLQCKILPLCKGSCRRSRFEGQKRCIEEKFAIVDYIANIYKGKELMR
jgi:uncharacterized protein